MSVGEREVAGDLSVESGEELERQQRLTEHTDFDPYRWRVSPEKAAEMEFFLKGDLLEVNPLLEAPEYDTVEIVGVRNPDASADARRQYVESALLEFNDKESFDQVVAALQGEENEFTEQQPDSTIPMGRDFDWRGTEINIALSPGVPGESYSLDSYFARARRPDFGNQVSLVQARDNLGSERRTALHSVVNELKQIGATVYLTGSSVEKDSDPDDIDLAVEGLTENTDTPHYRAHCYPLPGGERHTEVSEDHPGLPRGMTVGYPSDIKSGIERRFDEVEVSCPRDLSGREHNPGDEYDFAEMLFRFEHEGEEFDVGYSQGPFNDSGGEFELLATRDQNYAKL